MLLIYKGFTIYLQPYINHLNFLRTVFFCLYAQFLLVSSYEDVDIRIVSILKKVETGANPMPIILAETIIDLDHLKTKNRLSGNLLLLQACNQNLSSFLLFYDFIFC